MKKMNIIVFDVIFMITLIGCVHPKIYKYHPVQQPNTTWVAENEKISFTIGQDATCPIYGLLMVDDKQIEFKLDMGIYAGVIELLEIIDCDENQTERIEYWYTKSVEKDVFTIIVTDSTYFKKNQEIVFIKVGKTGEE